MSTSNIETIARTNATIAILEDLRRELNGLLGFEACAATVTEGATEEQNREFWGQFWPVETMDPADLAAYGVSVRYDLTIMNERASQRIGHVYNVPANAGEGTGDAQQLMGDLELAIAVAVACGR